MRKAYFEGADTESAAMEWIVAEIMTGLGKRKRGQGEGTRKYRINGKEVCGEFWRRALGVSKRKMTSARLMADHGGRLTVSGKKKRNNPNGARQYQKCFNFWYNFFEHAQRPNNQIRLFPCDKTLTFIYEE
jgi:hypothetical protein